MLYRPPLGATARARLGVMRETNDGFEVAQVAAVCAAVLGEHVIERGEHFVDVAGRGVLAVEHREVLDLVAQQGSWRCGKICCR